MLLMPDHSTPCELRTHTDEPVPYLLFDATEPQPGGTFTEEAVANLEAVPAHTLVRQLLS
jgi:2,3-bisphosphoglycerate-independent phosphoglycerate mutase